MNTNSQEMNQIRDFSHSGQLFSCNDEARLIRMVAVISHFDASGHFHMTEGVKEAVKAQLERVQSERRYVNGIAEMNRIHKAQTDESNRRHSESSTENDKKHVQTLQLSKEANALSKGAVVIAILSVLIAAFGVYLAHRDSTPSPTSGTNATEIKIPATPPEKPQIVSPKPLPISTNPIPTNAIQKK